MEITLYITKDMDAHRFGWESTVTLEEPPEISRVWIRRVIVELPKGFEVTKIQDGRQMIFCGEQPCEVTVNKDEDPVILDCFSCPPSHIPLKIVSEGWDENEA